MSDQGTFQISDSQSAEPSASPPTPGVHNLDRSVCEFDSFAYQADENVFHATYAPETTEPSIAVVSALAAVTDTDPLGMEPLGSAVDTDALDSLLAEEPGEDCDASVTFAFDGHDVTAHSGGSLSVHPPDASDA